MKILITILFFFASINLIAQNDEYIIANPKKSKKNPSQALNQLPNPDYTNYFLMPTAFTLKKNEIRLASTDILFGKASFGLTDRTMLSVNISLFTMATVSIKHSKKISEDITLAGTVSGGQLFQLNEDTLALIGGASMLASFGDIQNNITAGIGLFYLKSNFDFVNDNRDLTLFHFFVGLQRQISRRVYFSFDGMFFPRYQLYTGSVGVKITIKENMSLGLGFMPIAWNDVSTNGGVEVQPVAIPIVAYKILFNR